MQFRISYQEISDLIEKKAGKRLPVVYGGPHTVRIAYEVNMFVKTASVGFDLTVEGIEEGDIILSYDGGMGIDYMVGMALNMAKSKPGGEMIEDMGDHRIRLCLSKNAQAGSLFEQIDLQDIRFDEQHAIIEFVPRNL